MENLVKAISEARKGVEYDPYKGAFCPMCGQKLKVTHTRPWLVTRTRYHQCENHKCPFHLYPEIASIKSKEVRR